jgi:hypothetical protein
MYSEPLLTAPWRHRTSYTRILCDFPISHLYEMVGMDNMMDPMNGEHDDEPFSRR